MSETFFSLVRPGTVFQGTFVDDVASAMFWIENPKKILVLGGGEGSVLLPLSTFPTVNHVTLVDIVKPSLPLNSGRDHGFEIDYIQEDAASYMARPAACKFDLVYCDLFTRTGYVDLMLDPKFYANVYGRLKEGGGILVNAFDVPNYLLPETGPTVTAAIASALLSTADGVKILKHRRNSLLLGLRQSSSCIFYHETTELSGLDLQRMTTAVTRAHEFKDFRVHQGTVNSAFSSIDSVASLRGGQLLAEFRRRLQVPEEPSFIAFALTGDLDVGAVKEAIQTTPFLRHIILMELAAHAFEAPGVAYSRLLQIINHLEGRFFCPESFETQAWVDLHAICLVNVEAPPKAYQELKEKLGRRRDVK